ncbi:hypothetical protein CDL12_01324 [Handroanthus impetiginosus]|uniref:Uncharacterized protein n=1 Tax=Handroanthus impetiginosus TaxID=429701 RepID=A0A2G9I838_9LAMI|nr:hypothetical protein CDL12_01324 [Handroanthus impetiginosus]
MSTKECSSSESGWTKYIATSEEEEDDEEDRGVYVREGDKQDVDSDDSMASDASSGPSDQYGHFSRHHGLANKDERKYKGKKNVQQEEKKQQVKIAKDMSGHKADGAGKSKKK